MTTQLPIRGIWTLAITASLFGSLSTVERPADRGSCDPPRVGDGGDYDPLALARQTLGKVANREATVSPQCYTKTDGVANPCWTCHTVGQSPNHMDDWHLQREYAFSDFALVNRWTNLFADRGEKLARISDAEVLVYVRQDNYTPFVAKLNQLRDSGEFAGYVPDLDFERGFDSEGFARDGSSWRAIRYKPFPGTYWPTNGSTDDVMIRLPARFRENEAGRPSRAIYKINLAILEATIASPPRKSESDVDREIEPIDEKLAGFDVDGDGEIAGIAKRIAKLPEHYVGGAAKERVARLMFPLHTEFLHTVRYVDPDSATLMAKRMKEVRYSRKVLFLDKWARLHAFEREIEDKERGRLPVFAGAPWVGPQNEFGWQLQGFIEDAKGRLRLQTEEEHLTCMGCHGALGVTVDNTFTLARKVPGAAGWRHQDIRGIQDVPQSGHSKPEILTWFERVGGGDEFRTNREVIDRFFPKGKLDTGAVRRAAKGGDKDISYLIAPSRGRAILLDKIYMSIVRDQSFHLGRDALIGPVTNVLKKVENESTDLGRSGKVFSDGRLWLDW